MARSCSEIAQSLYDCIKESACVKKGGDIRLCLREARETGDCQELRYTYMLCKRGGLDMRNRIRGIRTH